MSVTLKLLLVGALTAAEVAAIPVAAGAQIVQVQPAEPSPAVPATPPGCPNASGHDTTGNDIAHSCGVIVPPETGDTGVKPAPASGAMPVIPPPGTPGGDPNVQPK
jgi:hypothetical protein